MLEIGMNNVTKNYGFMNVLDGVSLEIMTGDRIAIVGRNGGGKTTILKIISGEENIGSGLVTVRRGATIGYLEQIPKLTDDETALTRDVLMAPFEQVHAAERRLRSLEASMATETDMDALDVLMRKYTSGQAAFEAAGGYEIEERFGRVTTGFGLTDILDRPFNVLSGGQKTVVSLACVMLREPDILLLDEPTNHLDMRTLEWFEQTLEKYRGTVLIVSHDRYFLDRVAKKTVILDRGQATLYHGNYTFSQEEQERQLLLEFEQYKQQQKKIEAMRAAIKRFRDWADRANNEDLYKKAKMLERRLEKMEMIDRPTLQKAKIPLSFSGGRTGREVLRLEDFDLSIGDLSLIEGATQTVFFRDRVCLMGDNGTGKTTLLRGLLGEMPLPEDGSVFLSPSAKIGYIPQEIRFGDDTMSVLDAFRSEYPCPEGMARNILAKYFFFGENVFKRVSGLSGGEKVLLKLAILVQQEVSFLILDEPTNHIDIETREMLENALLDFGGTLLFISHDRYFIQKIATRLMIIENKGLEAFEGTYEEYRDYLARVK